MADEAKFPTRACEQIYSFVQIYELLNWKNAQGHAHGSSIVAMIVCSCFFSSRKTVETIERFNVRFAFMFS